MTLRALLVVGVLGLAACGGGGGGHDDPDALDPTGDGGGGDGDGGGGSDDGGGGGSDGGGGPDAAPPPMPVCVASCGTAADCGAGPAGSIGDADNYSCDAGACVWTGCNSTAECVTAYGVTTVTCAAAFGSPTPTCWPTCATAADCGNAASPIAGEDNYACDGGMCRWTGCNDTAECTSAYQSSAYRCAARAGQTTKNCWHTCTTPADCTVASGPYDADNYACDDGLCAWTGCNSTAECATVDPDWICR